MDITANLTSRLPTIMISSMTLVAGLAWNEAFKQLIDNYAPAALKGSQNVWYKMLYALIVTIAIVVVISFVTFISSTANAIASGDKKDEGFWY